MKPPLYDDVWTRRGITLLWDADALARLCQPHEVVSVRRFFRLHEAGWPEDQMPLVQEQALVVAGLESCLDALPPDEAARWLEKSFYDAVVAYQRDVARGGSEAALLLWLADPGRIESRTSDGEHYWHCGGEYRGQQIALGRCLFNGVQHDLRQILVVNEKRAEHCLGLYHPRIS